MKKILFFTMILTVLLSCTAFAAEPTGTVTVIDTYEVPQATAYYQDTDLTIDGDISDWVDMPKNYLTYLDYTNESGETLYQSDSAYFMITWDETGIYQATFIPDSTQDLDPYGTRDWYAQAYNLGATEGPLTDSFSVCTVNCDGWHPNLSNYDVLDVGTGGFLVADGTIQMFLKYVDGGVTVESYLPFVPEKLSELTDGTVMDVSIRYDDGRNTDYTYEVKHYRYLWGDNNEVLRDDAAVMGEVTLSAVNASEAPGENSTATDAEALAEDLKTLGLFIGTENGFELDRAPTRIEALVMLIRLLGVESDAKNGTWSHPFTDVPDWAAPYVGYAYEKGLTAGVSDTLFGTDELSNAAQYLTFVLRALGYSDADGDFVWNKSNEKAAEIGLIGADDYPDLENGEFLRADTVIISYSALSVNMKDTETSLVASLIDKGAVDADLAAELNLYVAPGTVELNGEFTVKEIGFVDFSWITGADDKYDWQYSIIAEDGVYRMWWTRQDPMDTIWYAESTDLKHWTNGRRVMKIMNNSKWIKGMLGNPSVLHIDDTYYMYFEAPATMMPSGGECDNNVFLATSKDPNKGWKMYPNDTYPEPVIRMNSKDMENGSYGVGQPHALYIDGEFWVYYCDVVTANKVMLAKSKDGIDFGDRSTHQYCFNRNGYGVVYYKDLDMFIGTYEYGVTDNARIFLNFSEDGVNWQTKSLSNSNPYQVTPDEIKVIRSFPDIVHDAYGHVTGTTIYLGHLQGSRMHNADEDWRVTASSWDPFFIAINLGTNAKLDFVDPEDSIMLKK